MHAYHVCRRRSFTTRGCRPSGGCDEGGDTGGRPRAWRMAASLFAWRQSIIHTTIMLFKAAMEPRYITALTPTAHPLTALPVLCVHVHAPFPFRPRTTRTYHPHDQPVPAPWWACWPAPPPPTWAWPWRSTRSPSTGNAHRVCVCVCVCCVCSCVVWCSCVCGACVCSCFCMCSYCRPR
jgi:hypothetical protein